ncbi:radical SAM protein [Sinorhizobium medicae]|nr:radical SAM protein [Sinorhizobium medicae]
MARVLLVNPPIVPTGEVMPPTGLCAVAGWLTKLGHDVALLDLALELRVAATHDRATMRSLTTQAVEEFEPDLVGVTSMYNNSIFAEELVGVAKSARPTAFTVAAGPHFGANAARAVKRMSQLDAAISGEGEIAIELIAKYLDGHGTLDVVPNIAYRRGGEVRENPTAPLINLADYDFNVWETCVRAGVLNLGRYALTIPEGSTNRAIYVEAGRGCPFDCTFCAPAQFWARKYRLKSPRVIADEIRFLNETAGYDYFLLVHDLLTANRARALDLALEIERLHLPIQWMANSRVDIDLSQNLPAFRRSGLRKFFFGVETASDRMQADIGKFLPRDSARRTVTTLREHDISATCSFVIGLPDETTAELSQTLGYGAQLALTGAETVQFHRLRLFPPAPLAMSDLDREFDAETLELEFPFSSATQAEVDAIQADSFFFSGYFAPESKAGTSQQLSQVELIFQQMVSLAPFSLAALHGLLGDELIDSFYGWLLKHGVIARSAFTSSTSTIEVWHILRPIVEWIAATKHADGAAYLVARDAIEYDSTRLTFLNAPFKSDGRASDSTSSGAFIGLNIDIARAFDMLSSGQRPDLTLLEPSMAIFVRTTDGTAVAMRAKA